MILFPLFMFFCLDIPGAMSSTSHVSTYTMESRVARELLKYWKEKKKSFKKSFLPPRTPKSLIISILLVINWVMTVMNNLNCFLLWNPNKELEGGGGVFLIIFISFLLVCLAKQFCGSLLGVLSELTAA